MSHWIDHWPPPLLTYIISQQTNCHIDKTKKTLHRAVHCTLVPGRKGDKELEEKIERKFGREVEAIQVTPCFQLEHTQSMVVVGTRR